MDRKASRTSEDLVLRRVRNVMALSYENGKEKWLYADWSG
jgi:hypothetical protein